MKKVEGEERKAKPEWSGKKYEVTSFLQPGFASCSVGFYKWNDSFNKTLKQFRETKRIVWMLRVKQQWTNCETGRNSTTIKTGVFKTLADVIKAIEEEEGGAK